MKLLTPLLLCLATSCASVEWVDYGEDPMQNPQYMADMAAAGAVGPQHEAMAKMVGNWKVEGKSWMAPGTDPMPMDATAKVSMVLGGRYLIEEFKSDFMGQPFEGRLVQGYDNIRQMHWCMWTDNMSTGCFMSDGVETSPGVIEFVGTATDILTPGGRTTRMVATQNDDGTHSLQMYDTREGSGEFMSMELNYTRG